MTPPNDEPDADEPDAADRDLGERPAQGADESASDALSSLPPGAHLKRGGPRGDVDRAQPYDEEPATPP